MHTLYMGNQSLVRSDALRLAFEVSVVCGDTCTTSCREAHRWIVRRLQFAPHDHYLATKPGHRTYLSAPYRLLRHGRSVFVGPRVAPGAELEAPPRTLLEEITLDLQDLGEWESLPIHSFQSEVEAHLAERKQVTIKLPRPLACISGEHNIADEVANATLVLSINDAHALWGAIHDAIEHHKRRERDLEDHFRCSRDDAKRWSVPVGAKAYRTIEGAVYVQLPKERFADSSVTWGEVRTRAGVDRPLSGVTWPAAAEMVAE